MNNKTKQIIYTLMEGIIRKSQREIWLNTANDSLRGKTPLWIIENEKNGDLKVMKLLQSMDLNLEEKRR